MEPDNLVARPSGDWVKRKHHYLRRYCEIVAVSMKGKWRDLTYIDLLAGPGRCVIRDSGELVPGSPLAAMDFPFTKFLFYEESAEFHQALLERVNRHEKAALCEAIHADWTQVVLAPGFRLPEGLVLAFVDPTGISQVPWNALKRLATSSQKIDILMTIQHGMGIKLNQKQYLTSKRDITAVDAFLGGTEWRTKLQGTEDFCSAVLDEFTSNMATLGFQTRKWMLVKNDAGSGLYYLCPFTRHALGLHFWDEVVKKDEVGQRAFDL